jgi:hypothetical protein
MPRIPFDPAAIAELAALWNPYRAAVEYEIRRTLRAHGLTGTAVSFNWGSDGIDVPDAAPGVLAGSKTNPGNVE